MRTLDDVLDQFAYHPATEETAPRHSGVRDAFSEMAEVLWDLVPDGPEKTLVFRKLQEAQMYANLAIALTAPADRSHTRGVARRLPEQVLAEGLVSVPEAAEILGVSRQRALQLVDTLGGVKVGDSWVLTRALVEARAAENGAEHD